GLHGFSATGIARKDLLISTLGLVKPSALGHGLSAPETFLDVPSHWLFAVLDDSVGAGSGRGHSVFRVDTQFIEQRPQMLAVLQPPPDCALINRLAHLRDARRAHRPPRFVEGKTSVMPVETAMGDDAARLLFQARDHFLVLDLDHHAGRQYSAPMRHQRFVGAVETAELAK